MLQASEGPVLVLQREEIRFRDGSADCLAADISSSADKVKK